MRENKGGRFVSAVFRFDDVNSSLREMHLRCGMTVNSLTDCEMLSVLIVGRRHDGMYVLFAVHCMRCNTILKHACDAIRVRQVQPKPKIHTC